MIKNFARTIACLAVLFSAQVSYANSVAAGDWIRFTGTQGTLNGGAFTIDDLTDPGVADFLTFCLQLTEYMNYESNFLVGSITDYADDDSGDDVINAETSWIMSNFSRGQLGGYSSDDIQWAIWQLEGEKGTNFGNSDAVIALATAGVQGGWTNDGVRVLNLFHANGAAAQDQLVYTPSPVPEPGTFLLVGGGVLAAVMAKRRRLFARN
jgi:hypothetical protein